VPVLATDLEQNTNQTVRFSVIKALLGFGGAAQPAIPALVSVLNNATEPRLASKAADALAELHIEPAVVVPELAKALQNTNVMVRHSATRALGEFGAHARSAVPSLVKALNDADHYVRGAATNALMQIAPAQFPNPLEEEFARRYAPKPQ